MRTKLKRIYKSIKRKYAAIVFNKNRPYLNGYERIYHVHIRKSAGTSINSAFWALSGLNLKRVKRKALLIKGKYIYVRNNEEKHLLKKEKEVRGQRCHRDEQRKFSLSLVPDSTDPSIDSNRPFTF